MKSKNSMIVGDERNRGSSAPCQLIFSNDASADKFDLQVEGLNNQNWQGRSNRPFLFIGRSSRCDIVLPDKQVSNRHACLQLIGDRIYCIDLLSQNGTYWGKKRKRSGWVKPGLPISIGPFSISTGQKGSDKPESSLLSDIDLLSPQHSEQLLCYPELTPVNSNRAGNGKQNWEVQQPITLVGSSPYCRLQLDHPTVSKTHCSLMVTAEGLWVIDLLSQSGTYVNGEQVGYRLLQDGDDLQIGKYRFSISYKQMTENAFHEGHTQQGSDPSEKNENQSKNSSGFSEDFVLSLVDRFTTMQHDMATMNHQQMMVMSQLVGTMHQNHHDLVQDELIRIHQINDQILQIQKQLTAGQSPQVAVTAPQPKSSVPEVPRLQNNPIEKTSPNPLTSHAISHNVEPVADPANQEELSEPKQVQGDSTEESGEAIAEAHPPLDAISVSDEQQTESPEAIAEDAPSPDVGKKRSVVEDVDSHAHLLERMASLECERKSRWKTIMEMMTGSGR